MHPSGACNEKVDKYLRCIESISCGSMNCPKFSPHVHGRMLVKNPQIVWKIAKNVNWWKMGKICKKNKWTEIDHGLARQPFVFSSCYGILTLLKKKTEFYYHTKRSICCIISLKCRSIRLERSNQWCPQQNLQFPTLHSTANLSVARSIIFFFLSMVMYYTSKENWKK